MQVHVICWEAPARAALSKTPLVLHYVTRQSVSEYKAFRWFPGKDVYKQLMMIDNELSKVSLESIDITVPCRNGPGMRRR